MMNLEDFDAAVPVREVDESVADRWIRARLNRTIADVVRGLDEYRFNDAAAAVYQFVWHEFCDWYLELTKPVLYGKENPAGRRAAQKTLLEVLTTSLKLLHPFMPFLTEEIWQTLVADGTSVMVSEFPAADDAFVDPEAETEMAQIMEVITRIRNIRGEMNVAPSLKLKATLTAPSEDLRRRWRRDGSTSRIWPIWRGWTSPARWRNRRGPPRRWPVPCMSTSFSRV